MTKAAEQKFETSLACRRAEKRDRSLQSSVRCWTDLSLATDAVPIELDNRGGRFVLPWPVEPGEFMCVSLQDEGGQFETRAAHVVWTRNLNGSDRMVAGLVFANIDWAA